MQLTSDPVRTAVVARLWTSLIGNRNNHRLDFGECFYIVREANRECTNIEVLRSILTKLECKSACYKAREQYIYVTSHRATPGAKVFEK